MPTHCMQKSSKKGNDVDWCVQLEQIETNPIFEMS